MQLQAQQSTTDAKRNRRMGMRPFGGLWDTARFTEAERWLNRQIGTTVLMISRDGPEIMASNAAALMNPKAKNGIPTEISDRLRIVMTVPLAFGRAITAKTPAGQQTIRRLLTDTASGKHDSHYTKVAKALLDGGHGGDIIRLGHEQTGAWYPWSAVHNADHYQQAYRHVANVMKQTAPKLRFEYNCAVSGLTEWAEAAYPGDEHVDIIGLDIYNKKQGATPPPFQTTWQRKLLPALETHLQLARTHGKPVSYAEWANGSVDEPAYIANMAEWFRKLPAQGPGKLSYHCYFNVGQPAYKLTNYPQTSAEYKRRFGN